MSEHEYLMEQKKSLEGMIRASEERCDQIRERLRAVNAMLEKYFGAESEETTQS